LAALLIFGSCTIFCSAQYRVLPGNVDANGFPTTPARICLGTTEMSCCYIHPDYMKDAPFGLSPKAQTIAELDGQDLTLFTATFSGGGSGDLTNFALLVVKDGGFVNLLPKVQLTNQSEYQIWSLPQFSKFPVLVTADFIWDFEALKASNGQQETHFARHQYSVRAFVFDTTSGQYLKRIDYTTQKKYPGLDEVDSIHVLDPEKPAIEDNLRQTALH
jgi:hypothetical protein